MAQMLTRGTPPTAPTGVTTVADLLSRYAPAPVVDPEPITVPVSVGSLLRREGRAPHALDRPLRPRASQVRAERAAALDRADDEYVDEPESRRGAGMLVRRGAVAAGVLVAAGSVFGAAVVDDASSRSGADAQAQGGYPGQGRLDPAPDEAVPTVIDPAGLAALSEVLDPGEAPSTSWMEVAGGGGAADRGSAGSAGGPGEQRAIVPADGDDSAAGGNAGGGNAADTPTVRDRAGQPAGGGSGGGQSGGGADYPAPTATNDAPAGGLGGAVQGVGGAVPGPVGGAVEGVGGAVGGLGDGVQTVTGGDEEDPGLVGSVGRLAGSLL